MAATRVRAAVLIGLERTQLAVSPRSHEWCVLDEDTSKVICHSFPARLQTACPRHMQLHGDGTFGLFFCFFFHFGVDANWRAVSQNGRPMLESSGAIAGLNFKVTAE